MEENTTAGVMMENPRKKSKAINDSVHGTIILPEICMKIIDTQEFQRLRWIRQLGFTFLVYPGAIHTRFEHSIGVCYLAEQVVEYLKNNENLGIEDKDKYCVMIAGLCHDLGHGPFSHMWEKYMKKTNENWKHETVSTVIFDYLVRENELLPIFKAYGLEEGHIEIIKKMILGVDDENNPRKAFLYQIVNSKMGDLDVDKWDYFMRDCQHLGLKSVFDYKRLIYNMGVRKIAGAEGENEKRVLCFRDKEINNIIDAFQTRFMFYRKAYKHRVVTELEYAFFDILKKGEEDKDIENWRQWSNDAFGGNCKDYIKITDWVVWKKLQEMEDNALAKWLLTRNNQFRIYRFIYLKRFEDYVVPRLNVDKLIEKNKDFLREQAISEKEKNIIRKILIEEVEAPFTKPSDFDYQYITVSASNDTNPIEEMYFYSREDPVNARTLNNADEYANEFHTEKKLQIIIKNSEMLSEMLSKMPSKMPQLDA